MSMHRCTLVKNSVFSFLTVCLPIVAFALLVPTSAYADVVDYAIAKELGYQQTGDNTAPGTPVSAEMFGNFAVNNSADFNLVSLSGGAGLTYSTNNGGFDWEGVATFGSQSAMDAAFPNGVTYTLNASGGSLGSFSEPITFDPGHAFPDTPFFTGSVFSDAQGLDASQPFTFDWNTPPADGFAFFIEQLSGPEVFYLDGFGGTDTNVTVPLGTFTAGTTYEASIVFFDVFESSPSEFSTGTEFTGFIKRTSFQFTTVAVPEPSMFAVLGIGLIGIATRRRSRTRV